MMSIKPLQSPLNKVCVCVSALFTHLKMGQWAELSQWKPLFFWPVRMSQMIMAWGSSLVSIRGLKVTTYLQATTQPVSDTRPSNCSTNIWSYMDYSTCCNTWPNLTRAEWYGEEKKQRIVIIIFIQFFVDNCQNYLKSCDICRGL